VSLPFSPASAMMSLRTMIDREKARRLRMTIAFEFPTDLFVGTLADAALDIRRGETDKADIRFVTDPTTFAFTVYGNLPFEQNEAEGKLRVEGDREAAQRFVDLFELPEKLAD
jgi:alkyl sulfatase BDS1-like metallo-beta-lactamase superfamily hydrolase